MSESVTHIEEKEMFGSWKSADYIEQRVRKSQAWYDKKAVTAKSCYLRMRTTIVLGGVIVPVIVNSAIPGKEVVASILSLLVAAFVALEGVYHYREQWKNYRSTEQFLSREELLFLTKEGGYKKLADPHEAFIYFVERCEAAIEAENSSTLNVMTLAQQEAKSV